MPPANHFDEWQKNIRSRPGTDRFRPPVPHHPTSHPPIHPSTPEMRAVKVINFSWDTVFQQFPVMDSDATSFLTLITINVNRAGRKILN